MASGLNVCGNPKQTLGLELAMGQLLLKIHVFIMYFQIYFVEYQIPSRFVLHLWMVTCSVAKCSLAFQLNRHTFKFRGATLNFGLGLQNCYLPTGLGEQCEEDVYSPVLQCVWYTCSESCNRWHPAEWYTGVYRNSITLVDRRRISDHNSTPVTAWHHLLRSRTPWQAENLAKEEVCMSEQTAIRTKSILLSTNEIYIFKYI